MTNELLKEYLKNRRLELGLSLRDVARLVGVNASSVMRWETGDIDNMKRDRVLAYAKALQVPPAVIMGWEDIPTGIISELTNYEEQLLDKFRALPPHRQHDVERIINMYYEEASS
jgi:transcriptional regulator with XRE-family HTH domain